MKLEVKNYCGMHRYSFWHHSRWFTLKRKVILNLILEVFFCHRFLEYEQLVPMSILNCCWTQKIQLYDLLKNTYMILEMLYTWFFLSCQTIVEVLVNAAWRSTWVMMQSNPWMQIYCWQHYSWATSVNSVHNGSMREIYKPPCQLVCVQTGYNDMMNVIT
jgi:hypothetical protein